MSEDKPTVLVVDDDPIVLRSIARCLDGQGYVIETFSGPREAMARVRDTSRPVDLIFSDINMSEMSGLAMVQALRVTDDSVPVVFVTGAPQLADAMTAIELGAYRYLTKPIDLQLLRKVAADAIRWGRLARLRNDGPVARQRDELEAAFHRARAGIRMVYQPIVAAQDHRLYGYEALMRSSEPALPSPPAVIEAAEKLGRLHQLGRQLRDIVAVQARAAQPFDHVFFVNLHSSDLADPTLYDASSPLTEFASSIVLEITERASIEGLGDLESRLARLREFGYRIAIDDLGAGYAGLSYFARLRPNVVKIDISLTRGIDADPVRQRIVRSLSDLAHELEMQVVAEGIETSAELGTVNEMGVDLIQGYLIARPGTYPWTPSGTG